MRRLRKPLSPRDFATQSNEIENELSLVREVRDLWMREARGLGKDRTSEFQGEISRLEGDLDELRKRAGRTHRARMGGSQTDGGGAMGQAWGD